MSQCDCYRGMQCKVWCWRSWGSGPGWRSKVCCRSLHTSMLEPGIKTPSSCSLLGALPYWQHFTSGRETKHKETNKTAAKTSSKGPGPPSQNRQKMLNLNWRWKAINWQLGWDTIVLGGWEGWNAHNGGKQRNRRYCFLSFQFTWGSAPVVNLMPTWYLILPR